MTGMIKETYLGYLEQKRERAIIARANVAMTVARLDQGFSELDTFDVDDFMNELVLSYEESDYLVLDETARVEGMTSIIHMGPVEACAGLTATYEAEVPIERGPMPDVEKMISDSNRALVRGTPMPPFPLLTFDYRPENRPTTRTSTMDLYRSIDSKGFRFLNPTESALMYTAEQGVISYSDEPVLPTHKRYVVGGVGMKYYVQYPTLYEMNQYLEDKEFVIGFIINPYQPASHNLITRIERKEAFYDVSLVQGYREYKTRVNSLPLDCHRGIYRYSIDAWSSFLHLRIRDIHPRWYAYDMLSTRDLSFEISIRRFIIFSADFLAIRVVKRDGMNVSEIYDGTPARASLPPWQSLVFRTWTTYEHIRATKEYVLITPLILESKIEDESVYLRWPDKTTRQVRVRGLIPLESTIYRRAAAYYEIRRVSSNVQESVEMVNLSMTIFREYANFEGSYLDDINIINMTQYARVQTQDPRVSMNLRSYLLEPDLRMNRDLTIDDSADVMKMEESVIDFSLFGII